MEGVIIISIIVAIVVFLIAREFMCWYYKINRLVALMEEQNDLLKRQLGISFNALEFIPTHRVKLLTSADGLSLRKQPNAYTDHFKKIPNGTEIQHINTGDAVDLNGKTGSWFEVKTKDGTNGWCFSGSLEKI